MRRLFCWLLRYGTKAAGRGEEGRPHPIQPSPIEELLGDDDLGRKTILLLLRNFSQTFFLCPFFPLRRQQNARRRNFIAANSLHSFGEFRTSFETFVKLFFAAQQVLQRGCFITPGSNDTCFTGRDGSGYCYCYTDLCNGSKSNLVFAEAAALLSVFTSFVSTGMN